MLEANQVVSFRLPIVADSVLSPQLHYGSEQSGEPITGIYFLTDDDQHGRITFENLDALRLCRGEAMPYSYNWDAHERGTWVFKVKNSSWQQERFAYENKHYGRSYEFGGNVQEMLTDFSHYLFSFHDQFIEVIARGIWFEQAPKRLFGQPLLPGHPLLALPASPHQLLTAHTLVCQVRYNPLPTKQLLANARYCSQLLLDFALELDDRTSSVGALVLAYHNGQLTSRLHGYFGSRVAAFDGIATLDDVRPYLEKYLGEVYERRKASGKN